VADRLNQVAESNERDNRGVVAGKRLLALRPQTNADLAVENFSFGPNPVYNGQKITLAGQVRNKGTQNTGPFWIEFWRSYDRTYPALDFFLCDSISVSGLAAGGVGQFLVLHAESIFESPDGKFRGALFRRPHRLEQ